MRSFDCELSYRQGPHIRQADRRFAIPINDPVIFSLFDFFSRFLFVAYQNCVTPLITLAVRPAEVRRVYAGLPLLIRRCRWAGAFPLASLGDKPIEIDFYSGNVFFHLAHCFVDAVKSLVYFLVPLGAMLLVIIYPVFNPLQSRLSRCSDLGGFPALGRGGGAWRCPFACSPWKTWRTACNSCNAVGFRRKGLPRQEFCARLGFMLLHDRTD